MGKPDLQEGVETRRHGDNDEDSDVCKKKSGGGPPDLSRAGSRDGCPRLKVLEVPKKKDAPMNVCDLRIRFDRCVCIESQGRWTRLELHWECVLYED